MLKLSKNVYINLCLIHTVFNTYISLILSLFFHQSFFLYFFAHTPHMRDWIFVVVVFSHTNQLKYKRHILMRLFLVTGVIFVGGIIWHHTIYDPLCCHKICLQIITLYNKKNTYNRCQKNNFIGQESILPNQTRHIKFY